MKVRASENLYAQSARLLKEKVLLELFVKTLNTNKDKDN